MFEKVNFQTGPSSFGTGIIVSRDDKRERVKVLDESGDFWTGSLEQIELINTDPPDAR